jgi:hypothetical protein
MWVDKAQTFALANDIGGERLMRRCCGTRIPAT